jgi:3-hydroxyacyl-CoA dehydrogenase
MCFFTNFVCQFLLQPARFPGEPAFVMPEILKEKMENGDLGRKTGKGFYLWDGDKRGDPAI